jgi:uncharacterized protein with beta-barrel porin domain
VRSSESAGKISAVGVKLNRTGWSAVRSGAAVAAVLIFALAWPAGESLAQCAPVATAAGPNGATVNCNGIVNNQNAPDGYGTNQQSNDTINVQTGSVTGTNNGFNLLDGNTINLATGTSITGGLSGIVENGTGTLTVNNNNGGSITGNGANSLVNGIVSPGSATVMNTGSITATTTAVGGSAVAVNVTTASNVTNGSGGQITGTGNGGEAVGIQGNAVTLSNSGSVSASGGTAIGTFTVFGLNSTNVTNGGTISANGTAGGTAIAVASEGTLSVTNNAGSTIKATGAVSAAIAGEGSSTMVSNAGILSGDLDAIFLTGPATITNTGTMTGGNAAINASLTSGAMTLNQNAGTINGTIALSANADVVNVAGGAINGNIIGQGTLDTINFALGSGSFTYNDNFTTINQVNVNSGTVILNGTDSATNLAVNGGVLAGTGTIQTNLTVNSGGMFAPGTPGAPGTFMTVTGNLTFQPGSMYLVQLNPATSTFVNVSGTATLAGTAIADFLPGSYLVKQYTILESTGLGGTQFSGLSTIDLPAGFTASLVYSGGDVLLDLSPALLSMTGLNQNQQNVANAINNFFNNGGALPPGFVGVLGLTGANLANALTQLDGENATGAEKSAFQLMNEFLTLMLDPYADGRIGGGAGAPLGFAPDQPDSLPPDIALAYAGVLKAPQKPTFEQRWTAWGAGFGGSATANGNAAIGSNNVTTGTFGYAAGLDYHYSPDTVVGFSLAGGGTSWNLANALGTGRSEAFLAGIYGVTHQGPVYLAGALAFANNWFTTNRIALGDQLTASFQGQSYAARLEGGYRFVLPAPSLPSPASGGGLGWGLIGVTPYAAIQAQNFHSPAYSETDLTAGGFGLSYNAMNGTDTRSELGGRFDDLTAIGAMPLILRARVAWAHDWVSNPALNASFESLPGTAFTVFGAPIPHDSALTSAGAQLFFTPNWSFLAKFDGEFASGSQTYAGSGTLRYSW